VLGETRDLSLVEVELLTGRTHQIRAQFSSRGCPLYGDRKYGGCRGDLALCACSLAFTHPLTGEKLRFEISPDYGISPWNFFKK
jgi:23S rRNA pseudouridine1911/1915/1917 synthase